MKYALLLYDNEKNANQDEGHQPPWQSSSPDALMKGPGSPGGRGAPSTPAAPSAFRGGGW